MRTSIMLNFRATLLVTAFGASLCAGNAQTAPAASGTPDSSKKVEPRVSLVAIGDPPSPDYTVKGDRRQLSVTPESEYPPTPLYVKIKGEFKPVSLGLNTPAETLKSPGGGNMELFGTKDGTGPAFATVPIPPNPEDLTIFFVRNGTTKSWRLQSLFEVYENGLKAFPKDSVRIMNFARVPVRVQTMEGQWFEVPAFSQGNHTNTRLVPLPHSEQGIFSYRAAVLGKEGPIPIADTATTYPVDARINLVIYEADGRDKHQPVKVAVYFELPFKDPEPASNKSTASTATPASPASPAH